MGLSLRSPMMTVSVDVADCDLGLPLSDITIGTAYLPSKHPRKTR